MSKKHFHIDQLLREKFENFQVPFEQKYWEQAKAGIPAHLRPSTNGFNFSLLSKIVLAITTSLGIFAGIFFYSAEPKDSQSKQNILTANIQEASFAQISSLEQNSATPDFKMSYESKNSDKINFDLYSDQKESSVMAKGQKESKSQTVIPSQNAKNQRNNTSKSTEIEKHFNTNYLSSTDESIEELPSELSTLPYLQYAAISDLQTDNVIVNREKKSSRKFLEYLKPTSFGLVTGISQSNLMPFNSRITERYSGLQVNWGFGKNWSFSLGANKVTQNFEGTFYLNEKITSTNVEYFTVNERWETFNRTESYEQFVFQNGIFVGTTIGMRSVNDSTLIPSYQDSSLTEIVSYNTTESKGKDQFGVIEIPIMISWYKAFGRFTFGPMIGGMLHINQSRNRVYVMAPQNDKDQSATFARIMLGSEIQYAFNEKWSVGTSAYYHQALKPEFQIHNTSGSPSAFRMQAALYWRL